MSARKYLPTLSDLVDRLSITLMKSIFIPDHAEEYRAEMDLIIHDIDVAIGEIKEHNAGFELGAAAIHAIQAIMLTNRAIWEGESKARAGGDQQDQLLKLTHSLNGQRNAAKNVLSALAGERRDWKVDAFAASLVKEYGNWQIFNPANDP